MNTDRRNIFGLIIVGAFVITGLIACSAGQGESQITNPFSPMLEVLVQKSDFTNEWDWVNSSIGQFPDVPSQENGQLIEWATHSLQGYYGTERYQMNFFHVLHRYDREVTLADIEAIEFPHTANSKPVQLALKPLGNQEIVNCIKTTEILECQVIGIYKNIVSIFRFWLPSNMQEDEIIKVLDPVLEKVDSRAKELEGIK